MNGIQIFTHYIIALKKGAPQKGAHNLVTTLAGLKESINFGCSAEVIDTLTLTPRAAAYWAAYRLDPQAMSFIDTDIKRLVRCVVILFLALLTSCGHEVQPMNEKAYTFNVRALDNRPFTATVSWGVNALEISDHFSATGYASVVDLVPGYDKFFILVETGAPVTLLIRENKEGEQFKTHTLEPNTLHQIDLH